jgi:drug/metabolite transporter (DMT)-like permease
MEAPVTLTTVEPSTAPPPREERPLLAIALRLLAVICLSAMFATAKVASERGVHVIEALFYRQALALPLVFSWIALSEGPGAVRTRRIGVHASRAALGIVGLGLNFGSYILLPLTEATTIGFTMPIFGTILSALLLREATGWHRWAAVLLGFVGVLVMVRPDAGHFPPLGVAVALSAAILTACVSIVLRELGRTERPGVVVFWFTLLSLPPLAIAMPFFARSHDPLTWGLLLFLGLIGGVAQLCLTGALRWAPVSVVLPMDYSAILWATLIGWLVWDDLPIVTTWIGAALIVGSGLYIAWREHVRARRARILAQ